MTARDLFTDTSEALIDTGRRAGDREPHIGSTATRTPGAPTRAAEELNLEAAPLERCGGVHATPAPSSGCCGSCGEASAWRIGEHDTGMVTCGIGKAWERIPAHSACLFSPSKWVELTPKRKARRDAQAGIDAAAGAADRAVDGWTARAYDFVCRFAEQNRGRQFIGAEIVKASLQTDLPQPPNPKAWGQPIQRAVRRGILVKAGYAPDPNRHENPVPLWEAA